MPVDRCNHVILVATALHGSGLLAKVLRLPTPKPDFVFRYSKQAFNTSQFEVTRFLETKSGEDYRMPDGDTMFPFLVLECKTQATGGTHFVATNQTVTAGAVAMKAALKLALRIPAERNVDFDEPMFFSITIDHLTAYINFHWLSKGAKNGPYCFHMRRILRYFLDVDGLKAVNRVKFIHYVFHVSLVEQDTTRKGQVYENATRTLQECCLAGFRECGLALQAMNFSLSPRWSMENQELRICLE